MSREELERRRGILYFVIGSRRFGGRLLAVALFAVAASNAAAVDCFWNNASGGNWNVAANWDTGSLGSGVHAVPAPGDNAFITLDGTYTVTLDVSPTINSLTLGAATGTQTLSVASGRTLTLGAMSSVGANGVISLVGTLTGAGNVTIDGRLDWTAGTMTGATSARVVTIALGATLTMSTGNIKTLGCVIDSFGTTNWTAGVVNTSAGTFNNKGGGIFNCSSAVFWQGLPGGANAFNNEGSFTRSGTGTSTFQTSSTAVPFNNLAGGTVDVTGGALAINAGGTNQNTMTVGSTESLSFAASYTHATGSDIAGAGSLSLTGGTHVFDGTLSVTGNITNSATLTFNHAETIEGPLSHSGTLNGSGDVTFGADVAWTAGTITGATSGVKRIVPAGATLTMSTGNIKTLGCVIDSFGTTNWTAGVVNTSAGTFNNKSGGIFNCSSPVFWQGLPGSANAFNNEGSFTRSGTGTSTFQTSSTAVPFTNNGTIDVQAGTLALLSGLTNYSGSMLTGGTYSVVSTLQFQGANIVTNAATIILDGAASAIVNQSNANGIANFATNAAAAASPSRTAATTPGPARSIMPAKYGSGRAPAHSAPPATTCRPPAGPRWTAARSTRRIWLTFRAAS